MHMSSESTKKQNEHDAGAIVRKAIEVLKIEANGIINLVDRIDDNFSDMIEQVCSSSGRLIISGIGKSGIVGRKIVATLNSTGTRSLFLHPVEAMHGDLGQVSQDDIFIALSTSGETDELCILLPSIRKIGCKIIAFTGSKSSSLAIQSDIVIDVGVECEACPLGLAPTASTTAMLAMGDALAVVLLGKKDFKSSDFKMIHPGGTLGQRLACKVEDLMLAGPDLPQVYEGTGIQEAVKTIDRGKLGTTLVTDSHNKLSGIITDGDVRRLVASGQSFAKLIVEDVMTKNPRTIAKNFPAYDALNIMEQHQITVIPIVNPEGVILGILHLHDILGKGEFKFNGS